MILSTFPISLLCCCYQDPFHRLRILYGVPLEPERDISVSNWENNVYVIMVANLAMGLLFCLVSHPVLITLFYAQINEVIKAA